MLLRRIIKKLKVLLGILSNSPLRQGEAGNFVFIHINKTGGTSIAKAIELPNIRHLTVKDVIGIIGQNEFNRAFVFTVVRNPWAKAFSLYNYKKLKNKYMQRNPLSFSEWVECTFGEKKDPNYYDNPIKFAPQVEWLKDNSGKIPEMEVLRFETLSGDFDRIKDKLGVDISLPHLNATKAGRYTDYYDTKTKEIVEEWFREDIERFGYKFGE